MSLVILGLAGALTLVTVYVAMFIFSTALFTLNMTGFLWGRIVGDLRWRSVELQNPAASSK